MAVTGGEPFAWSTRNGIGVVHLPGELDLANADLVRRCCQAAIAASGSRLVVDLSGTTFLDSTALNVFVQFAKRLNAEGGWLRLVSGNSSVVRKLLEITRLEVYLGSHASVDEAMDA